MSDEPAQIAFYINGHDTKTEVGRLLAENSALKLKVEVYEDALMRISMQPASPNFGTPAYDQWEHWCIIADKALKRFKDGNEG